MLCTWMWLNGVDKQVKMDYYQNAYDSAQVNDIKEYTGQTLGNIIDQMSTVVIGGIVIAFIIVVLITALFLKDVIIKGYVSDCHHAKYGLNF